MIHVIEVPLRPHVNHQIERLDVLLNDGYECVGSPVVVGNGETIVYTLHKPDVTNQDDTSNVAQAYGLALAWSEVYKTLQKATGAWARDPHSEEWIKEAMSNMSKAATLLAEFLGIDDERESDAS